MIANISSQYLAEITAVLGPSTGAHILREEPYALVVLANSNNYKTENHSRTVASVPRPPATRKSVFK